MNPVIEVHDIKKVFPARRGPRALSGRGGIGDWMLGRRERTFTALQDISFDVAAGESLGIIGRNGSGKSTLLSIIAGVTLPTEGHVVVRGRVASLLELGAGFSPILTGRENVYLNAGLLGMRHAQVDGVFDEIVRFSGIEAFIDQPVETYSSGMYVRIAFAVAVHTNPDIFIADEVLAVGDAEFQRKCRHKIGELREQGKTIVFVSHDLGVVNTLCERVVLLDKGRMIQRDTPQKTITYYLRQVGRDKGLHTLADQDVEIVHCDGRISLFYRQHEFSAPGGFQMQLASLGQQHCSTEADWEVLEKSASHCTVAGRMMRLPVRLIWELQFELGRLAWRISMECERDCHVNDIAVACYLSTGYTRWIYGDLTDDFPPITPTDTSQNALVSPEKKAPRAAVLPGSDTQLPPLLFELVRNDAFFGLFWANTDYINYSRLLCAQSRFPEHDCMFPAGLHPLMEITIDTTTPLDKITQCVCSDRTLASEKLTARFEHGQIRLLWDGDDVTSYLHVYTSMLINHIWNDSHSLQWGNMSTASDGLLLRGESRRFPFWQIWELKAAPNGVHLQVWLETKEELDVQEYHTTIVLPAAYNRWQTDHEKNVFPEYVAECANWVHCNREYAPGKIIGAFSAEKPAVFILLDEACPEMRMTAINTTEREQARAIQALRTSSVGRSHFEPGRHLYFSGTIQVKAGSDEHAAHEMDA